MIDLDPPVERFPALDELEDVQHGFVLRVPGLDVRANRDRPRRRGAGGEVVHAFRAALDAPEAADCKAPSLGRATDPWR